MKKKAAKIFTAFIMTAIIAQGTVMVAGAAEIDSTPDSVAVVEVATPDSSALESGADSTSVQPIADVIYKKWRRGSHGQLQYRRWNETKQEWVDDEWIDYKGKSAITTKAKQTQICFALIFCLFKKILF